MKTSDFDYNLPVELIAQTPVEPRDSSRLMVLNRGDGSIEHRIFSEITGYLHPGDVLILNDSRVMPARFNGRKAGTGGKVEILLLRRSGDGLWQALLKPGKRVNTGTRIEVDASPEADSAQAAALLAEVVGVMEGGVRLVRFSNERLLSVVGKTPLPPYIHTPLTDTGRYQTIYAAKNGSVAAPTAGLHFTPGLLDELERKGVTCCFVTLHIGLDTFRPVKEEDPENHPVYCEYGLLSEEAAGELTRAKRKGRRIVCVGTTTARLLEHVAKVSGGELEPFEGWVDLLILHGYRFRFIDALITNFHLPRSTLLMMVSAFAGIDIIKQAYSEAIAKSYHFYSFGDAMFIL
ncbi:tRNA preQ1(34) S-adenosylmethionine ribosyltransferase-isomerase QueA [Chloroflexota bacterium]